MEVILVAAAAFLLCFVADKAFTKLFRNRAEHRSGMALRLNKRFATFGVILSVISIAGLMASLENGVAMLVGSLIILLVGVGLIVHYMSFGIYYDHDGFLLSTFGKKSVTYRYNQIRHQKLYLLQGGGTIVELHMTDGRAVQILSSMPDYGKFLDHAFDRWCYQRGLDPENCAFHDPDQSLWFPNEEE